MYFSDCNQGALDLVTQSLQLNNLSSKAALCLNNWEDFAAFTPPKSCNVVIASDVIYPNMNESVLIGLIEFIKLLKTCAGNPLILISFVDRDDCLTLFRFNKLLTPRSLCITRVVHPNSSALLFTLHSSLKEEDVYLNELLARGESAFELSRLSCACSFALCGLGKCECQRCCRVGVCAWREEFESMPFYCVD